jgi:Kelch motif
MPRVLVALAAGAAAASVAIVAASGERTPTERGGGWDSNLAQSPFQRSEVGAARIGDRIYVVGGFLGDGRTTGSMAAYDISEDEWHTLRALPQPANHPGVTSLRGKLYVLGGQRGTQNRRSDALWRYNPKTNRWKRLPDAPTARAAMGFASRGRKLFAAGGQNDRSFELRQLQVYDVRKRKWRRLDPMPTGRNHLTAVAADGTIWAIGGRRPGAQNLRTVERYDPGAGRWRRAPKLNVARSGIASAVADRSIIVFGGEELDPGGTTIAEVERLRFGHPRPTWRLIEPMPAPRHGLGGAAKNGFVYALEGGPQPGLSVSSIVERLDLTGE